MADRRPVVSLLGTLEAGGGHPAATAALQANLDGTTRSSAAGAAGDSAGLRNPQLLLLLLLLLHRILPSLRIASVACCIYILHLAVTAGLTHPFSVWVLSARVIGI